MTQLSSKRILCLLALLLLPCLPAGAAEKEVMEGVPPTKSSQVTFANYRSHPFNSWSFRNVGAPLHVVMIPRSGQILELEERHRSDIATLVLTDAEDRQRNVQQILEENYADGFLVLQGNTVLYEQYFNGLDRDYGHIWYSMTKSLAR